jgi:hypothetical protein
VCRANRSHGLSGTIDRSEGAARRYNKQGEMASLAVGSARLGGGFDSPSLEGARTPPVSKYNPHYHARDDFYVVRHKQSPPQSTTPVSRPRTASSSDKKLIEQPASALAYKNSLDNHWNSALPDTPQSHTTFRSYRTDVGTIGVALGSPRDNPLPRIPREIHAVRPKIDVAASPTYSWAPIVPDGSNKGEDALKSKGRWKVFGGIFTRKEPSTPDSTLSSFDSKRSSPPSFSRTSASSRPQITVTQTKETTYEQQPSSTVKAIARENTKRNVLSKKPKSENLKPAMHRAQTVPTASRSPRRSPSPSARNLSARAAVQRSQSDNKPSLLQLNLPDVSMERYSVMFSDVLKPTQPSLMQRRQAQLKELKTIGEVETTVRARSPLDCLLVLRISSPLILAPILASPYQYGQRLLHHPDHPHSLSSLHHQKHPNVSHPLSH